MQRYYENWKNTEDAQKILRDMFLDPQGLVLNGNAHNVSGVYMFTYVSSDGTIELPAYIGEAGLGKVNAPSYVADDIYERVLQHLKRWLGNPKYLTYWTGLKKGWKIKVQLLCVEEDIRKRKNLEEQFIAEKRPILQHTCSGRFSRYASPGYTRKDLCLHPWAGQRRAAFLARLNEVGMSDV